MAKKSPLQWNLVINYVNPMKAISNKSHAKIQDIFDIEPSKALIPPHGHIFATVSFTPREIRTFECIFEAMVEASTKAKETVIIIFIYSLHSKDLKTN